MQSLHKYAEASSRPNRTAGNESTRLLYLLPEGLTAAKIIQRPSPIPKKTGPSPAPGRRPSARVFSSSCNVQQRTASAPAKSDASRLSADVDQAARLPTSTSGLLAAELRRRTSATTETYVAYGSTEMLYAECARQADYDVPQALEKDGEIPKTGTGEDLGVSERSWYTGVYCTMHPQCASRLMCGWHSTALPSINMANPCVWLELSLTPTFNTWAQITFLHMYVLTTRFRRFPASHAPAWHQHLLDHFFFDAEHRMATLHHLVARSVRSRYLKDLFVQWRGCIAAYDEGLVRGDAVLATAVWRNVFKAVEGVDAVSLAMVVAYVRRAVQMVDAMRDDDIARGAVRFDGLQSVRGRVLLESRMMREPLREELVGDAAVPEGA